MQNRKLLVSLLAPLEEESQVFVFNDCFIFFAGTPFPCSLCKVTAVPQYHLAMVDGTIRNFCSYTCVTIFRVKQQWH